MRKLLELYIVSLVIFQVQTKRDFTIEVTDVVFNVTDWDTIKFLNISTQDKKTVNLELIGRKNVNAFDAKITFDILKKDNRYMNVLNGNFNGCDGLRSLQKGNFVRVIFKEVLRSSNFPLNCNFMADTLYYLKDYTIKDDDYPPNTPQMTWKIGLSFLTDKKIIFSNTFTGRVRKLKTK